jgi:hypothetical protein
MDPLDRPRVRDAIERPSPLYERRIDPGVNVLNPRRVDPPSRLAPAPPRGSDLTKPEARVPVKR